MEAALTLAILRRNRCEGCETASGIASYMANTPDTLLRSALWPARTSILDLLQVLLESLQDLWFLPRNQFALDFCKGKMHNVVMMQLLWSNLFAESKPKAVQHINLLGR